MEDRPWGLALHGPGTPSMRCPLVSARVTVSAGPHHAGHLRREAETGTASIALQRCPCPWPMPVVGEVGIPDAFGTFAPGCGYLGPPIGPKGCSQTISRARSRLPACWDVGSNRV
jgi:hypothetical protein